MILRGPGAFTFTTADGYVRVELEPHELVQIVVVSVSVPKAGERVAPPEAGASQEKARWFRQHAPTGEREIVLVALGWLAEQGERIGSIAEVGDVLRDSGLTFGASVHNNYWRLVKQGLCKRVGWGCYQLTKRGLRELERMRRDAAVDEEPT